jgi:hypothetical protein
MLHLMSQKKRKFKNFIKFLIQNVSNTFILQYNLFLLKIAFQPQGCNLIVMLES